MRMRRFKTVREGGSLARALFQVMPPPLFAGRSMLGEDSREGRKMAKGWLSGWIRLHRRSRESRIAVQRGCERVGGDRRDATEAQRAMMMWNVRVGSRGRWWRCVVP